MASAPLPNLSRNHTQSPLPVLRNAARSASPNAGEHYVSKEHIDTYIHTHHINLIYHNSTHSTYIYTHTNHTPHTHPCALFIYTTHTRPTNHTHPSYKPYPPILHTTHMHTYTHHTQIPHVPHNILQTPHKYTIHTHIHTHMHTKPLLSFLSLRSRGWELGKGTNNFKECW